MTKKYDVTADFYPLYFKQVRVIDIDGVEYIGEVDDVGRAEENDSGEDSIGIITRPDINMGVDLNRSEILSIEILE